MALPFLQAQLVKYVTERVLEALARQVPRDQLAGAAASLAAGNAEAALHRLAQAQAELAQRLDAMEAATRAQQDRLSALERRPHRTWPIAAGAAAAGSLVGAGLVLAGRATGLW